MNWKDFAILREDGYFTLATEETGDVPVRLFLTPKLLEEVEDDIYKQIVNATKFPGVKLVSITPDVHVGYGVPIGCVLVTDGTLCLGPVGYDMGCGMVSARSTVPWDMANSQKRLEFNKAVMSRVEMGMGGKSKRFPHLTTPEFENLIRGGAEYYYGHYGSNVDRSQTERNRLPVDDSWQPLYGGKGKPERGIRQLGSLGGGKVLASQLQ
jgi:tRNA-splicing ligase RtcB (3'-phosphate/5'-hydroxy nucleic acid ligase)